MTVGGEPPVGVVLRRYAPGWSHVEARWLRVLCRARRRRDVARIRSRCGPLPAHRHPDLFPSGRLHAQRRVGSQSWKCIDRLEIAATFGNHSCAWYSGHYAFGQHFHISPNLKIRVGRWDKTSSRPHLPRGGPTVLDGRCFSTDGHRLAHAAFGRDVFDG